MSPGLGFGGRDSIEAPMGMGMGRGISLVQGGGIPLSIEGGIWEGAGGGAVHCPSPDFFCNFGV